MAIKTTHYISIRSASHHVECGLRGLPSNAVPASGKKKRLMLCAGWPGHRDMNGTDGLFRRASGRSGNTGDAHANRRSNLFAHTFGETARDFLAHGALHFQQQRRNSGKIDLGLIAVGNDVRT